MKDTYILIAYKPETYISSGCGCCPGTTYDHDYQLHQFEDIDEMADKIKDYAISNAEQKRDISGYGIWIIYNGDFIIGNAYDGGADPCKKLFNIDNFTYGDNIEKEIIWEKILKSLDEKIDQKWRLAAEQKKEDERIRKENERKSEEAKKLADKLRREKLKEENDKKKLKELAEKYPEVLK
jgi:hypothetical protein